MLDVVRRRIEPELERQRDVTVTITNNGTNDLLTVSSGTCTFNFGQLALGADYVTSTVTFGGSGSDKSSIAWTAGTGHLVITFGTAVVYGVARAAVAIAHRLKYAN